VLMWPLHGLMAQHFGLWELMVMAVFCLGVLAVFREQHILDIVPESLAFWAPTPSTPTEPAEESTTPAGRDGFESGDTIAWHIPASSLDQLALAGSPGDFLGLWSLDLSTLPPQWRRAALAEGVDADGRSIFVIEAQRTEEGVFLRARMSGPDGTGLESRGVAISDAARRLEVDWRQSLPALRDGQLLVSVNGHLICWLVDLDNSRHALWAVRYSSALSLAGHP
ncbi:MAG: hypothetical protein GY719_17625, partial [bacterium]|nr:hypothetical protein [bacterium]